MYIIMNYCRKNALAMAKSGHDAVAGVDLTAIKAGGKSIGELTGKATVA